MPPKKSNKNQQKKVQKIVEDRTFGMKNKKGSSNQKKVQQIQSSLMNQNKKARGGPTTLSKKQLRAQREQEMRQLGIAKVVPKKSTPPPQQVVKEEISQNNEVKPKEKTLEDTIEELLANLNIRERVLITKESFAAWDEKRRKEKEKERAENMKRREKDIGTGKVRMTGRELYEQKRALFVDDNDADDTVYDLHEGLDQAIEEQLRLMEDAEGVEWDEERRNREREKLIRESRKENPNDTNTEKENLKDIDESLFVDEEIPDE